MSLEVVRGEYGRVPAVKAAAAVQWKTSVVGEERGWMSGKGSAMLNVACGQFMQST
jgi:hypothetical protein